MAEREWEEHTGRGGRPVALTVLIALAAVVLAGMLVRPAGERPSEPITRPTAEPTTPPTEPADAPTQAPTPDGEPDESEAVVETDDGEVVGIQSFDPSRRWTQMAAAPFDGAARGPAVWDGRRMLAWPGSGSGGAYDPEQDVWSALPPAPMERAWGWSATWNGKEMIVWGGEAADGTRPSDGAAFDPRTYRWRRIPDAPVVGRTRHAAVRAGDRLIVWGGIDAEGNALADGASYDPETDTWELLPPAPLSPRWDPTAVWWDGTLVIWGGDDHAEREHGASLVDGARYRPGRGWLPMSPAPVPLRGLGAGVLAEVGACPSDRAGVPPPPSGCDALLVWGRPAAGLHERDGYAYDIATDTWSRLPLLLNQTRSDAVGLWTGTHAVVWGGVDWRGEGRRLDGYAYDPVTEGWVQIPARPGEAGADPTVLWTGEELIVWSGADEGWRYPLAARLSDD